MTLASAIGANDTIGTGEASPSAAKYVMRSPIFGACDLVPQDGLEPASHAIGYVELEGAPGKLVMAFYQDGAWRGRNLKPFPAPVACWYKMVRPDGTEPF